MDTVGTGGFETRPYDSRAGGKQFPHFMTFRAYMIVMALATLVAGGSWVFVLWNINPVSAEWSEIAFFFVTLCMTLVGTFTLLGVGYRVGVRKRTDVISREVKTSFRQAILLTAIAIASLILSVYKLLHVWVLVVLIGVATLCEYLAIKIQRSRRG